jgi:hypothetical protein
MPLILGGVAIVTLAQRRQKLAEPEPRPIGEPLREVG